MDRSKSNASSLDSQALENDPLLPSPEPATAPAALGQSKDRRHSSTSSTAAETIKPGSADKPGQTKERSFSSLSSPSRRTSEVPGLTNRPPPLPPSQFDNPHAASAAAFQANHESAMSRQQRLMVLRLPPRHATAPGGGLGYIPASSHQPESGAGGYAPYSFAQGSVSPNHYARRGTMPYFPEYIEGASYQKSSENGAGSDGSSNHFRSISLGPSLPVGSPPGMEIPIAAAQAMSTRKEKDETLSKPHETAPDLSSSVPAPGTLFQDEQPTMHGDTLTTLKQETSPGLVNMKEEDQLDISNTFPFLPDTNGFGRINVKAVADFFEQGPTQAMVQRIRPLAHISHKRLRFMFYSDKSGPVRAPSVEKIDLSVFGMTVSELLESGPFWLDVCDPTDNELQQISRAFGIHPLTREDIQTPDTREKCELFTHYYFVVIRSFEQDQASPQFLQAIPVYLVVFRDCVISIQYSSTPHAPNVLYRIEQLKSYGLQVTADWINYAMIDDILDNFVPILKSIEFEVDSIDDLVLILKESEQSDMLGRIGRARKRVMQLVRLLTSKADVIKMVINRVMERVSPESETRYYLEDIHDHVITMSQNAIHYEKTLARTHSNYLAQISIEITQSSNRTSDIAMKMTALASILVPLNVITGLWGMNVKVPGQEEDSLFWFGGIVVGMTILAGACYMAVRKAELV